MTCVGYNLCHPLHCSSLLNELYVLGLIFVAFLCNMCGCSCSPFWWCSGSCPSEVGRRLLGAFCVLQTQSRSCAVLPEPRACRGAGMEKGHRWVWAEPRRVWPPEWEQAALGLRGARSLPTQSWHVPFVTARQGKRVKELPSHLTQRNTWKKKGCQECCWEQRQLFAFCPPTEYNLFKYWHVLLLKDFPFFHVLFWLLSMNDGGRGICTC